ncbi:transcription antitermination factor NusB [Vibrio sp. SS-MA-C1-2]|uniref:transcription antitermination factor NusB n=1 Tax=Vibrio sp. SS-MA-C1-2 TaxID=2908646 RepID=UPI001F1F39D3|nr:transcription antitermination factor NusB [Vibrio sp. SS-MA-C1-2]UJF18853.1 transcription antitermination factor NusB [Vibrio sp. SS-MA-C1-2]
MGVSVKPAARRNARHFALQAIYSWQITQDNVASIEQQFLSGGHDFEEEEHRSEAPKLSQPDTDVEYFRNLLTGVVMSYQELDSKMRPYLSRPLQDLDQMELALLRLAMYEMTKREDVPFKVVINEAIELAKAFGAEDSHKFVNGVLDKAAPSLRKARAK